MKALPRLRTFLFRCRYGFRGVPASVNGAQFRLDESLRRWRLDCEPAVTAVLQRSLRPGDLMLDLGANFGLHALYAARLVGAEGHVFAFEPVPRNLRLLERNLRLSQLTDRVTVVPKAVSNAPAPFLEMFLPNESVAVVASLRPVASPGGGKVRVPNMRLDDFPLPADHPLRLMKVDVEGAELEVLQGGVTLLRQRKPVLLVEVHGFALPQFGSSTAEFDRFLAGLGYRETRLDFRSARDDYYQALFTLA